MLLFAGLQLRLFLSALLNLAMAFAVSSCYELFAEMISTPAATQNTNSLGASPLFPMASITAFIAMYRKVSLLTVDKSSFTCLITFLVSLCNLPQNQLSNEYLLFTNVFQFQRCIKAFSFSWTWRWMRGLNEVCLDIQWPFYATFHQCDPEIL